MNLNDLPTDRERPDGPRIGDYVTCLKSGDSGIVVGVDDKCVFFTTQWNMTCREHRDDVMVAMAATYSPIPPTPPTEPGSVVELHDCVDALIVGTDGYRACLSPNSIAKLCGSMDRAKWIAVDDSSGSGIVSVDDITAAGFTVLRVGDGS